MRPSPEVTSAPASSASPGPAAASGEPGVPTNVTCAWFGAHTSESSGGGLRCGRAQAEGSVRQVCSRSRCRADTSLREKKILSPPAHRGQRPAATQPPPGLHVALKAIGLRTVDGGEHTHSGLRVEPHHRPTLHRQRGPVARCPSVQPTAARHGEVRNGRNIDPRTKPSYPNWFSAN